MQRQREAFVGAQVSRGWSLHLRTSRFGIIWETDYDNSSLFYRTTPHDFSLKEDQETGLLATALKQRWADMEVEFLALMTKYYWFPVMSAAFGVISR